jgi:hypothetical protein
MSCCARLTLIGRRREGIETDTQSYSASVPFLVLEVFPLVESQRPLLSLRERAIADELKKTVRIVASLVLTILTIAFRENPIGRLIVTAVADDLDDDDRGPIVVGGRHRQRRLSARQAQRWLNRRPSSSATPALTFPARPRW